MKRCIGRGGRLVAAILLIVMFGAVGRSVAQTAASKPAQIDRNGVIILIRTTLIALDQANKTGNYTVLRDLGAPAFQANTAARLAEIFAGLRRDRLDLSGVAVIDPQLSVLPEITPNGLMHMRGFFPSVSTQINFDLTYAPVDGQWRLFGLSVGLGQAGPVAPQAPPAPQALKPVPAPKHKPAEPRASTSKTPGAKEKRAD